MALYLTESDVRQVLTPAMALQAVELAHREMAEGEAVDIPRARTRLPQTALHILQGALPRLGVLGYKAYTSNRSGNRFLVHLFDAGSGEQLAVVETNYLGMIRTGAASGLAARVLALPGIETAGVFGAGWQAEGHVRALQAALPTLRRIEVWARRPEQLAAFCERMSTVMGLEIKPATSPQRLVESHSLLGTVTTAASPLFDAQWLQPGTHINAAGSNAIIRQELSEATVRKCDRLFVDSVPVALAEAGDLLPLLEKGRIQARQLMELGDVLTGRCPGRQGPEQITLFESQGMAIQDLAVAQRVLLAAKAAGLGREIVLP